MFEKIKDVHLQGGVWINGSRLNATGEQINQAVQGGGLVAITASIAVSADVHAGNTNLLDSATGLTVTFPTATGSGNIYRFVTLTGLTSNSYIFQVAPATDDQFVGIVDRYETTPPPPYGPALASKISEIDTVTFISTENGGQVGDEMIFQDIQQNLWFMFGRVFAANTTNSPFTSVITAP